ncbi:ABC transporter ATP-binding protein [Polaromonas sp.]|uniref:ABC transporter ATP-binding protein n=1 Tax=Polaromonas sp. TaxID=1869339 RepID=UPI0027319904|nr:ABC transporter ATP-binding protein [Polaromonas sp.]MDP1740937.1 ABC transporter ATP-binding protein [Polaromonas sp.]
MLSLINICWTTEAGLEVLRRISFDVHPGEFVCIVGPSGSGKTSLLRMMAGIQEQTSGQLTVQGSQPRVFAQLSYVFQEPVLLPWLTVRQNVDIIFTAKGQEVPRDRVDASLELVRLADFADYLPRQLSGGMQSRASIARALANDPLLLLMDEPFSSLDEISREHMNAELQRIMALTPASVVFVTHDLAEAVFLADRVIVLTSRPGRVFDDIAIPFARPRITELLESREFELVLNQLRRSLRAAAHCDAQYVEQT